jgi:hypothetical protein
MPDWLLIYNTSKLGAEYSAVLQPKKFDELKRIREPWTL